MCVSVYPSIDNDMGVSKKWRIPSNHGSYQYVQHKAVAEVSKLAHYRRLVAVNHASQSKSTDGSKHGWRQHSVVVFVIVISFDVIVVGVVVVVQ